MRLAILFIIALGTSFDGDYTFKSQYVGELYVRTFCDDKECLVSMLLPKDKGCDKVTRFMIPLENLQSLIESKPMESCGRCMPRKDCARLLWWTAESKAFAQAYDDLGERGFRSLIVDYPYYRFSNKTSGAVLTIDSDSFEIRVEGPERCVMAKINEKMKLNLEDM